MSFKTVTIGNLEFEVDYKVIGGESRTMWNPGSSEEIEIEKIIHKGEDFTAFFSEIDFYERIIGLVAE